MRTAIVIATMAVALVACQRTDPVSVARTDNPEINVARLLDIDGCTVYRFRDNVQYVYFTKCPSNADVSYTENCGKNCTRPVLMSTVRPESDQ